MIECVSMYKKIFIIFSILVIVLPATVFARNFLRSLRVGDYGEDVRFIKQILNLSPETQISQTGVNSPTHEDAIFGTSTQASLIKFQNLYAKDILVPAGLSKPTGVAGSFTFKKINELAAINDKKLADQKAEADKKAKEDASSDKTPHIDSISPTIFGDNSQIAKITGKNFDPIGNTILVSVEDDDRFTRISSDDLKTIQVPLSITVSGFFNKGMNALKGDVRAQVIAQLISKGQFVAGPGDGSAYMPATIKIKNFNGESNSLDILVKVINK